ncbi:hypothetical protein ACVWXM_008336 [Bradyrhizobium sp. GM7.3]
MIGATSFSSRVKSAASWSKRPPSSCYRWRLPDVPWAHKRTSPPIPPSSPRAMPGTAPAKIPITRALLQNPARAARSERNRSQAALQPYSKEWWQAKDGIEEERDARVNRSLVICQGCLRPQAQPEDSRLAKATD